MSHEQLPSHEAGNALNKYIDERRKIVGSDTLKSGLKTAAVGVFAVGTILASRWWLVAYGSAGIIVAPIGLLAAGAVGGYGLVKAAEGGIRRLMHRNSNGKHAAAH